MYKRKLTLGVATAAALLLPLGFVSPAIAGELEPTPTIEAPVVETPADEVPAEEAPVQEEVPAAEGETDEQGSIDAPAGEEPPVVIDEPEAPANEPTTDSATKLADEKAGSFAASSTYKAVRLSNPGTISNPTSDIRTKNLVVAVDGPTNSNYYVTTAVGLVKKNAGVRSENTYKPTLRWISNPTPTTTGRVQVRVPYYTTPGVYKLRIVVTQQTTGVKKSVVKNVTIKANSKYSKSRTGMEGYARSGQTFPVKVTAPDYQAGAKVVVYYRSPGSSRYVAVNSGRLKASTYNSKATVNISKIYNVAGNGGRIYVKIGSVAYAPSYQVSSVPIV